MIEGISANDPLLGAAGGGPATQGLDKNAFMQLLVTQLKNQDPMAPTDNQEFIAQLAQFSALEEMQGVNENLVALALLQEGNAQLTQLTNSSALIGRTIVYADGTSGDELSGIVDSVHLADGGVLLSVGGKEIPLADVRAVTGGEEDQEDGDQDDQ